MASIIPKKLEDLHEYALIEIFKYLKISDLINVVKYKKSLIISARATLKLQLQKVKFHMGYIEHVDGSNGVDYKEFFEFFGQSITYLSVCYSIYIYKKKLSKIALKR